jgi:2-polyprenyl-3-methyl-5-hydroxy-6-metoxy-1,4-benzoquinol methylase
VWDDPAAKWALEHYAQRHEQNRLQSGSGLLEFARTIEILRRHLPPAPASIADVGAGGGPHSIWLAQLGHQVLARDLVLGHVEQLQSEAHDQGLLIEAEVGTRGNSMWRTRRSTQCSCWVRSTT